MGREEDADVEREKGNTALRDGLVPEAFEAYTRAISINPKDYKAFR